jgi:dTDP-4-dehydrorhamnose reductase
VTSPLLVTGGTGHLGSELVRQARGTPLAATWHESEPQRGAGGPAGHAGVEWLRLDVREDDAVRRLFERVRPRAVIHTAYRQDSRATTFDGALAVAAAAQAAGARLVHLSTDLVFDGEKGSPYVEADEPSPVGGYGRAKADAERGVLDAHPQALVVRTSLIVGGVRPSRPERDAIAAAEGRSPMRFFRDELRSPVHVSDLAAALLELVDLDEAGILHAGGADGLDRFELARLCATVHGLDPAAIESSTIAESGMRRARDCRLASDRARALLRTELRGAREALAATAPAALAERRGHP